MQFSLCDYSLTTQLLLNQVRIIKFRKQNIFQLLHNKSIQQGKQRGAFIMKQQQETHCVCNVSSDGRRLQNKAGGDNCLGKDYNLFTYI